MDDFTSNIDAIEFARQQIKELPNLGKEEILTLKKDVEEWCARNEYAVLNAGAKYFEDGLLPRIEERLKIL